jgi:hypothetical protein
MKYMRALAKRRQALARSRAARGELRASMHEVVDVYQAHPLPTLAGAAGIGFVLSQLRVGGGLVRAGVRVASGPAWRRVLQFLKV